MKNLIYVICALFVFSACKKEETLTKEKALEIVNTCFEKEPMIGSYNFYVGEQTFPFEVSELKKLGFLKEYAKRGLLTVEEVKDRVYNIQETEKAKPYYMTAFKNKRMYKTYDAKVKEVESIRMVNPNKASVVLVVNANKTPFFIDDFHFKKQHQQLKAKAPTFKMQRMLFKKENGWTMCED